MCADRISIQLFSVQISVPTQVKAGGGQERGPESGRTSGLVGAWPLPAWI